MCRILRAQARQCRPPYIMVDSEQHTCCDEYLIKFNQQDTILITNQNQRTHKNIDQRSSTNQHHHECAAPDES